MSDVPSTAVFCSESIECFPGTASKFSLKLLVTIPVAPIITGVIVHFRFHIHFISIPKLLYFNFFSCFLLHNISVCGYCHIYQCACFIIIIIDTSSSLSYEGFITYLLPIPYVIGMFVILQCSNKPACNKRCNYQSFSCD